MQKTDWSVRNIKQAHKKNHGIAGAESHNKAASVPA